MRIKNITVEADYCFGDEPLQLKDLKKVNFIFAPNGTGKTTISNILAKQPQSLSDRKIWQIAPTVLPIRVFNDAYRAQVLTEDLNGIFTMGEQSKDIKQKIENLKRVQEEEERNQDTWAKKINGDDGDETGLLGELADAKVDAVERLFDSYKEVDDRFPEASQLVFQGYRNSKVKFFDEVLTRYNKSHSADVSTDWADLDARARILRSEGEERNRLPEISQLNLVLESEIEELGREGLQVNKGKFAQLINHLKNEDWVSKGREYLLQADGKCPFCQGDAPKDLEQNLNQFLVVNLIKPCKTTEKSK